MAEQVTTHAISTTAAAVRVRFCRDAAPWHTHAGAVMVLIDGGERTLATTQTITRLAAGHGAIIPAGQAHAWSAEPAPGCSYRAVRIAQDACLLPAGPISDPSWGDAFDRAYEAIITGAPLAPAELAALVHLTCELLPRPWRPPAEPGAIRRARRLVQAHARHPLRLPALARAAGVSAFHLHRLYRRLWGVTPAQHGLEARLRTARAALISGASVAAAAAAGGFADQSHLTRAFRRFMGVPPEHWRRQVAGGRRTRSSPSRPQPR